ncbi:interleukin-1 receptor-like 1 [Perognathus longimembris pacificus]|uniref:interleukin-1 receptor-like 1 n=1 Tax=Perognathus longimembris pacificus TaxID=214514 RepID=UPI00201957DE|nr:interleukin-1 receptor-like 1 [Perognathus longimembris pacificus]
MGLWILTVLEILICFTTAAENSKPFWGLENEALIVKCPKNRDSSYLVDWYYLKTNESIPTQKTSRVFASEGRLKFLPAKVEDSGIYSCFIRSPTFNKTGYVNVTIYKKQPGCNIPDHLMYTTVSGSERYSRIHCPTIDLYNWTAPIEWFKNCKVLQGPRYKTHLSSLVIDNVGLEDEGDYTCKFVHSENGVHYSVTATRLFTVKVKQGLSMLPVIIAPPHNETREVGIGKPLNVICTACFGKGKQTVAAVLWQVNRRNVRNLGEARIQEEEGQNQSSSNELTCLNKFLRITEVREEDLSQKYDCVAWNLHGVRRHTIKLQRKKPSKECV